MIRIFLTLIHILLFEQIIAQKLITGIVSYENNPIQAVEVINLTQKINASTNNIGQFSIMVNLNDVLIFYSKSFSTEKIIITNNDLETSMLEIILNKKIEELDEIIINTQGIKWTPKQIQEILDKKYVDDFQTSPKNRLIYDGTIENGMDVNRMLGEVYKLFKKKKKTSEISFYKFATTTCDKSYFKEQLKMDSDEVPYFLEFCSKDPESKIVLNKNNVFDLMDFLVAKNKEYIKINEE